MIAQQLAEHDPTLDLKRLVIVMAAMVAGAFWLQILGPMGVFPRWGPFPVPTAYIFQLSAFVCLGLLSADLYSLWQRHGMGRRSIELALMIVLMVLLSSARVWLDAPLSGHSLLFLYFIVRRLTLGAPSEKYARRELALALVLFLPNTYVKIFGWHDPGSFAVGAIVGILLAATSWLISGGRPPPVARSESAS